ncbi:MAG TPA: DUF523 domain-containing protein [Thermoanaerobacterales bacterium]|nr:DUF523 domain-containing protein [Thermoanaerobacterales bacterium]
MIIVSACLCGIDCKYNGLNNISRNIIDIAKREILIPVCPEQLGGLSTPRLPSEIIGGTGEDVLDRLAKVVNQKGEDVTDNFIKGAQESLKIAKLFEVKFAILKSKSPSCGFENIYDGNFDGTLIKGSGVTASLLSRNGIKIYDEETKPGFY